MQRAALTSAPRQVGLAQVEPPTAGPDEALLRVEVVGICGTDLHIFDGSFPTELPIIQGHEVSAIVEGLPDGYRGDLKIGERVAIMPVNSCGECYPCGLGRRNTCVNMRGLGVHRPGALQERIAVPLRNVYSAEGLTPDAVALCETISVGHHGLARAHVVADDFVVVLGAGPVGLSAILAACDVGAKVMVLDQEESRLAVARRLGAAETVSDLSQLDARVADWTSGLGATLVVEATGASVVAQKGFDIASMAARIVLLGISQQRIDLNMRVFTAKELDVYGARSSNDFAGAVQLVRRHEDLVRSLVTQRYGLEDAGEAMAFAHGNPHLVVKSLVEVG
ncbi:2-deoxy-scyllo-inosamine dehydrogenase [Acrocarpospora pleiomorpha]|uniref:2-deoxy-scyllo-inosamine dehydrogenase n=1 Tax=Acrocarpospora pleiomorpha TaxID=90975 RepID=A0A5M3Y1N7_9ACTN|nr:alcohol dehydrogenase catalytic domain-containing protein [Acrocarpospora pleiomorpha]GES24628.1 2-deoxy-scyllo-inosamine dehydrogenase [Acrocarpospora pleiomorpha]